ncbi:MAG: 50S ribosomal protein L22 [Candidatus Neomarinimicrobiota bacterium]|nr:50S ribosomal protein L22 [Candidatus Neomarinimicrobiota bacterium]
MESKAMTRYIHQSPRKLRKTLHIVRGRAVGDALNILHFTPQKSALIIEKTIRSAIANMMQMVDDVNMNPEKLDIKEAFVNGGPVMKRFRAASMGRASRLRRPTSHLTIVLTDNN